ncbi:MAG: hypothetical protein U9Q73_00620 [Nanoarchaeota archaeon]|nr:hypothetical protein [Nanoarchaeota archaeon]
MKDSIELLINAKYHLAVADRMYRGYSEFADKRFLIGVINESARAVSNLIKAFLIYEGFRGGNSLKNMNIFMKIVAPKYLDELTRGNLFKVLEIERAQKNSPIEYAKGEKIILLIRGKYRFLTAGRIGEFIESMKKGIVAFPGNFRHI